MLKRNAVRHGKEFLRHVVPAVMKPAQTLWNEVIGFLFLCLALWFGTGVVRYGLELTSGKAESPVALILATFCFALTLWYCISSFRRARKISRS